MEKIVRKDRLFYKIGSLGWLGFFGIPMFLVVMGIIFFILNFYSSRLGFSEIINQLLLILVGIILYIYQWSKLKFKSLDLIVPIDKFVESTRNLLEEEGWDIEYDNKEYLQAVFRNGRFRLDLLTIKFSKQKIKYNLVHHPEDHNSIASLLSLNLKGRKTLKKILAIA